MLKEKNQKNIRKVGSSFKDFRLPAEVRLNDEVGQASSQLGLSAFDSTRRWRGGFSIVESLVAISILLLAIAAPMTMAQNGLTLARNSVSQTTAFYLGQEAVEYIRYIRDSNILDEKSWIHGLSQCIDKGKPCTIDVPNNEIKLCGTGTCDAVKTSPEGFYGHKNGWTETIFTREVVINTVIADREINVDVTLSWITSGGTSKNIKIHETLFNWQ